MKKGLKDRPPTTANKPRKALVPISEVETKNITSSSLFGKAFTDEEISVIQSVLDNNNNDSNLKFMSNESSSSYRTTDTSINGSVHSGLFPIPGMNSEKVSLDIPDEPLVTARGNSSSISEDDLFFDMPIGSTETTKSPPAIHDTATVDIKEQTWHFCHHSRAKKIPHHGSFDTLFTLSSDSGLVTRKISPGKKRLLSILDKSSGLQKQNLVHSCESQSFQDSFTTSHFKKFLNERKISIPSFNGDILPPIKGSSQKGSPNKK